MNVHVRMRQNKRELEVCASMFEDEKVEVIWAWYSAYDLKTKKAPWNAEQSRRKCPCLSLFSPYFFARTTFLKLLSVSLRIFCPPAFWTPSFFLSFPFFTPILTLFSLFFFFAMSTKEIRWLSHSHMNLVSIDLHTFHSTSEFPPLSTLSPFLHLVSTFPSLDYPIPKQPWNMPRLR